VNSHHPYRLYFIFMPGCETCHQTRPAVKSWVKDHPQVGLVEVNLATTEWKASKWTPSVVPTLILLGPDGKSHMREHGALKADVDNWVAKVAPELAWAQRGR
jgi:hypothetical protein